MFLEVTKELLSGLGVTCQIFFFNTDDSSSTWPDSGIWEEEPSQTVKMAHRYHCMDNSRYAAYASADCNFLWTRSVFRDKYLVNF